MDVKTVVLSARQTECLWWASLGKTAKETALILGVTERTVNFHLYTAFGKLNVHSKNAAVAKAVRFNLLTEAPATASVRNR
ncbi:helix-turn-helix transcriptional regulator [Achromobacter sp. GG226]|uniref:helix-turn-helix transcriptional regulator n=1 Tax=Verticiella alkaliphila TaxID=2779529 RepID=UPI001C0A95EB|nr:helix-turn-helix transcriptional regulator [Verticiella sp. GG226]MBU4611199.1 helix-turn-helix transcriptional regulator [Verticiella sp. GG226]